MGVKMKRTFYIKNQRVCNALRESLNETPWDWCSYSKDSVTVWSETIARKIKEQLDAGKYKYELTDR